METGYTHPKNTGNHHQHTIEAHPKHFSSCKLMTLVFGPMC